MLLSDAEILSFQQYIFSWWGEHKRDLPWRHTRDPYRILVSELMLQQTQVPRVLIKYAEFLEAFPRIVDLAKSSTGDVLRVWKGMGYNRRALYLKKLAEKVVRDYDGVFPQQETLLLKLPGLGRYTARAVLVFAFEQDVAMIDTNIRQIIVHHFYNGEPQKETLIQEVADQLVPKGRSWDWHQALMDYGSIELKKIKTSLGNPRRVRVGEKHGTYKTPFRDTNRFYRGRIVDLLREKSWSKLDLINKFMNMYKKDEQFIENILVKLVSEGLVEQKNEIISLPE